MRRRIFISGAVSSDPNHRMKFIVARAMADLEHPDCNIYTPTEIIDAHLEAGRTFRGEADYLLACLMMLRECDDFLRIKEDIPSAGADIEEAFAKYAGKNILPRLELI